MSYFCLSITECRHLQRDNLVLWKPAHTLQSCWTSDARPLCPRADFFSPGCRRCQQLCCYPEFSLAFDENHLCSAALVSHYASVRHESQGLNKQQQQQKRKTKERKTIPYLDLSQHLKTWNNLPQQQTFPSRLQVGAEACLKIWRESRSTHGCWKFFTAHVTRRQPVITVFQANNTLAATTQSSPPGFLRCFLQTLSSQLWPALLPAPPWKRFGQQIWGFVTTW